MLVGSAVPVFAFHDYGHGTPPEKACQGVIIGGLAHSKFEPLPHLEQPRAYYPSVKDYIKGAREGGVTVAPSYDPEDKTTCPPKE